MPSRKSHENPMIKQLYNEFLEHPNSITCTVTQNIKIENKKGVC